MKTIMLVEDNPDNRLLVQAILSEDFRLTVYEAGAEALEGLALHRPDLLLLDISLPGMDGLEVIRRIRDREELAGLPVVALTAHAMVGDRERFLRAGFDGYVAKPIVDEDELIAEIDRLIGGAAPAGQGV